MIGFALAAEPVRRDQLVRVGHLDGGAGHFGPVPAVLHVHVLGHAAVVELDVAGPHPVLGEGVRHFPPPVVVQPVDVLPVKELLGMKSK